MSAPVKFILFKALKKKKNRGHYHDRFPDSSDVKNNKNQTKKTGERNLIVVHAQRKITEKRIR
jgi:hypothetical protein